MPDEPVLAELRAIRDLLIMSNSKEIDGLLENLNEKHIGFLEALATSEWTHSSEVTTALAEEFDVSNKSIQRKKDDLLELGFIEQEGQARGTKYRLTGMGLIASRATNF